MNQKELNAICSRLERRLEFLEQRMINLGTYTAYRRKKSNELLQQYDQIQDQIMRLCNQFRLENN